MPAKFYENMIKNEIFRQFFNFLKMSKNINLKEKSLFYLIKIILKIKKNIKIIKFLRVYALLRV